MSQVVMLKCRVPGEKPCPNIAKALIITEVWAEGDPPPVVADLMVFPVCADHAPEEAHETAASMNSDEFLIVELPAFGVGGLT